MPGEKVRNTTIADVNTKKTFFMRDYVYKKLQIYYKFAFFIKHFEKCFFPCTFAEIF